MSRILRHRHDDLQLDIDQAIRTPTPRTDRMLVQLYNNGSMPTSVPGMFLGHPIELSGNECEGCTAGQSIDSSMSIPVVVLGPKVPVAGDKLVAISVAGRWVAESGSGVRRSLQLKVYGCTAGIPNAAIVISDLTTGDTVGTYTSDGDGTVTATWSGAPSVEDLHFSVTESSGRFNTLNEDYSPKTPPYTLQLIPSDPYACYVCNWPIAKTLPWTDSFYGAGTLTWIQQGVGFNGIPYGTWSDTLTWDCLETDGVNSPSSKCEDNSRTTLLVSMTTIAASMVLDTKWGGLGYMCCTTETDSFGVGVGASGDITLSCFVPGVSAFASISNQQSSWKIPPYIAGAGSSEPQFIVTE
jgi:hypothetical protein